MSRTKVTATPSATNRYRNQDPATMRKQRALNAFAFNNTGFKLAGRYLHLKIGAIKLRLSRPIPEGRSRQFSRGQTKRAELVCVSCHRVRSQTLPVIDKPQSVWTWALRILPPCQMAPSFPIREFTKQHKRNCDGPNEGLRDARKALIAVGVRWNCFVRFTNASPISGSIFSTRNPQSWFGNTAPS